MVSWPPGRINETTQRIVATPREAQTVAHHNTDTQRLLLRYAAIS